MSAWPEAQYVIDSLTDIIKGSGLTFVSKVLASAIPQGTDTVTQTLTASVRGGGN